MVQATDKTDGIADPGRGEIVVMRRQNPWWTTKPMDCELCQSRKSLSEDKNQQKDMRNRPNEHFCRVLVGKFGKGSLYFLPKSTSLSFLDP